MTYHCNPKTGKRGICKAASPDKCPFGVENHAQTEEEIEKIADTINQELVSIEKLKNFIFNNKTPEENIDAFSRRLDDMLEKTKKEKGLKGVIDAFDNKEIDISFKNSRKNIYIDGVIDITKIENSDSNSQIIEDSNRVFYRLDEKDMCDNLQNYNIIYLKRAMKHHCDTLKRILKDKEMKYRKTYELEQERKNKHYERKEFNMQFQLDKTTIFSVNFYTLGSNPTPHFATSADKLTRNKRSISSGGQCQDKVLFGRAKEFYEKWDKYHLKNLNEEDYQELMRDIETLKDNYNYVEKERPTDDRKTDVKISWEEEVELSKLKPKKSKKA